MAKIRVTKIFNFEMAHALWGYDGKCSNIHGHSYVLYVTVMGEPVSDKSSPKLGMVIDFGDLKKIVNEAIVNKYDHCVVLSSKSPTEKLLQTPEMFERNEITDYQPTCEMMISHFAEKIKEKLPVGIELFSLRLYETQNSFAEWFAGDNN